MKQETGKTNRSDLQKTVSIQLKLGGHSFSVNTLPEEVLAGDVQVLFEVLTPRCLLVPRELAQEQTDGAHYLAAAGIPPSGSECAVWSEAESTAEGIDTENTLTPLSVIAVAEATVIAIRERLGDRARFTTPLLRQMQHEGATVWIYRAEEVLYIKVWNTHLRFAEAIPAATEADMLYFITLLGREFPLRNYTLLTAGLQAKPLRKLLGKPFKKALCES